VHFGHQELIRWFWFAIAVIPYETDCPILRLIKEMSLQEEGDLLQYSMKIFKEYSMISL